MKPLLLLTLLTAALLHADIPLDRAIVDARRDLQQETMTLIRERDDIATQRRALQEQLTLTETRVTTLREQVERARRVQRQGIEQAQRQQRELHTLRQETADLHAVVREARRSLETALPPPLAEQHRDTLTAIDTALRQNTPAAALQTLLELYPALHQTLARPASLPATALTPEGLELDGTALLLGPLTWVQAHTPPAAGLLHSDPNAALPKLHPIPPEPLAAILQGQTADLPLDLTDGRALLMDAARRPWTDRLRDGGLTMIPLLLTALASLLLVLWKTISLLNVRGLDLPRVTAVATALRQQNPDEARDRAAAAPQPLRTLLEGALAHPAANPEELEEILHERMLALMPRLDRHLGTLAVLGGIAPLLGLLGTVTGMIHTFELVTLFGSGNERILSQGISEALVTTMSGLIIAVPVLLAHAFLARRVRVIISELEQSIALFIHTRHHGDPTP